MSAILPLPVSVILASLLLTGCSWFHLGPLPECKTATIPPLTVPQQQELHLQTVDWVVVTPDNSKQVFDELKKKGIDVVLFAVTDEGYVALSTNMEKVQGHLHQQRLIVKEYQTFADTVREAAKEAKPAD